MEKDNVNKELILLYRSLRRLSHMRSDELMSELNITRGMINLAMSRKAAFPLDLLQTMARIFYANLITFEVADTEKRIERFLYLAIKSNIAFKGLEGVYQPEENLFERFVLGEDFKSRSKKQL